MGVRGDDERRKLGEAEGFVPFGEAAEVEEDRW